MKTATTHPARPWGRRSGTLGGAERREFSLLTERKTSVTSASDSVASHRTERVRRAVSQSAAWSSPEGSEDASARQAEREHVSRLRSVTEKGAVGRVPADRSGAAGSPRATQRCCPGLPRPDARTRRGRVAGVLCWVVSAPEGSKCGAIPWGDVEEAGWWGQKTVLSVSTGRVHA